MAGNRPQNSPLEAEEIWNRIKLYGATLPITGEKCPIVRAIRKEEYSPKSTYKNIDNSFLRSHLGEILSGFFISGTKVAKFHCGVKLNVRVVLGHRDISDEDYFSVDDFTEGRLRDRKQ